MSWLEALILGLIQGLTEFLPVSSSGHLEIGKALLGIEARNSLMFTVVVHGATVLSTIVVFRKDLLQLIIGGLKWGWNEEKRYIALLLLSMIPVLIVGLFFKEEVEAFFTGRIRFVGSMLLLTAMLLLVSSYAPNKGRPIGVLDALIIGIAQAVAVLPGLSRSGSTIATGLILGNERVSVARFSFLMVLLPIIGANILDIRDGMGSAANASVPASALIIGFISAFVAGWLACRWMIRLVQKGNLIYFAIYCFVIGSVAIIFG